MGAHRQRLVASWVLLVAVVVGSTLLLPPGANGARGSAIDQYIESVPGPGGEKPGSHVNVSDPKSSLPSNAANALTDIGPDGERAAALAAAVGSVREGHKRGGAQNPSGEGEVGGVVGQLLDPGSDGIGFLLPLALALTLAAGVLYAFKSRFGRPEPESRET